MTLKEKKEIKCFLDNHRDETDRYQRACEKFNLNHDELSVALVEVDRYEKAQLKANLMSIGNVLFHFIEKTEDDIKCLSNEEYESVGREFCELIKEGYSSELEMTRTILKELLQGTCYFTNLHAVKYLLNWDVCIVSKPIRMQYKTATCKTTVYKEHDDIERGTPFYVRDAFGFYDKFCMLDGLISRSCCGKDGQYLVFENYHITGVPVILQAGFLFYGEYELWNNCEYDFDTITELVQYYENIGFINVNSVIGSYEDSVIMLACEDKELLERVTSAFNKGEGLKSMEEF